MRNQVLATAAAAAIAVAQPASADTVSEWMEFAYRLGAVQEAAGPRLPDHDRATTRTAIAMFEALNAIDRRYRAYLGMATADSSASQDAAASTAAFKVLHHHYPTHRPALEESYALAMATIADERAREAGRLIGEAAATAAIAAGGIDPSIEQEPYRPRTRPGEWVGASLPSLEPY